MDTVKCLETGKVYRSISEAAHQTGCSAQGIAKCCRGIYESTNGYSWIYVNKYASDSFSLEEVYIRKEEGWWGVFYKDALLKLFKHHDQALVYALDSALIDVRNKEKPWKRQI